ncbi:TonB-dependent receptor domain-containing protein [Emticicia sp. TH156]|uniref:TonB-dependent receptor n=1 Tax=Emticicia sp. TH156 TaxID=2067454 RepID=UPI001C1FDF37|nr:TonB-dependent receptor [Emticicia sp. TH156]
MSTPFFNHYRRHIFLFSGALILLLMAIGASAQQIRIQVKDTRQEAVPGATVILNQKAIGLTDATGYYQSNITLIPNNVLEIRAIGYETYKTSFSADTPGSIFQVVLQYSQKSLSEVVVTAGRKPEHISTIPSSITILSRRDIEAQSNITTDISSVLGFTVPGLGVSTNKAVNSGQTLRGRAVLVLIDGIPQSTPLMNGSRDIRTINPAVIERVEVIKGATSIYGNGSGGGIINYITKKNEGDTPLTGESSVGVSLNPFSSNGTLGYRASQYLGGKKGKWGYSVAGSAEYIGLQRDGEGIPLGQTDGLSNSYQYNAFAKVSYDINALSSVSAFYNYFNSTQHTKYISKDGVYGQTPTIGVEGTDPGKPAGTPFNHNALVTYTRRNLFGKTQLDASVYINSFSSMNRYVTTGTAWYGPGQTMINSKKKGLRINLNTPFVIGKMPAEITYGLDLLNDITNQDLVDGRVYIPNMNMVNLAPYAQLKVDIVNNLILKGGVRYENATVTINDFNTIATGPNNAGSIAVKGGKIPYNATMFNAGLRYARSDFFNPFVSFSQGFAINELGRIIRRATANTIESMETDPIITNNYEVGFSSRIKGFNFSAAYYISTSDLGANLVDVGGYLLPQREPERVYGYEVAADLRLTDQLKIGGTYAFVEGKAIFEDGSKKYLSGARIAPPKATGFLYYSPVSKLNLQFYWVYVGDRDRFQKQANGKYLNGEGPIIGYHLFNLAGTYNLNQKLSFSLGVENLFNNVYFNPASLYPGLNANYVRGNGTQLNINTRFRF